MNICYKNKTFIWATFLIRASTKPLLIIKIRSRFDDSPLLEQGRKLTMLLCREPPEKKIIISCGFCLFYPTCSQAKAATTLTAVYALGGNTLRLDINHSPVINPRVVVPKIL